MVSSDRILSAVSRARAASEAWMVDECEVTRPGVPSLDGSAVLQPGEPTIVYAGPCKIDKPAVTDPERDDTTLDVAAHIVHLPTGSGPFQAGDIVAVGDRSFSVTSSPAPKWATRQRVHVEEVTDRGD